MTNKFLKLVIKFFIGCLILTSFSSCESESDVKSSIDILKTQRVELQNEISKLESTKSTYNNNISGLESRLKELKIYESGKKPKYILKLHLKQSHISLSISTHIKDAANAIDFELPVDKEFYNKVKVGTEIVDQFRMGSMVLYGSFGSWEMTVDGKEIRVN